MEYKFYNGTEWIDIRVLLVEDGEEIFAVVISGNTRRVCDVRVINGAASVELTEFRTCGGSSYWFSLES